MPRDERFSARDKKTHKMTRDGLVERNEITGEEQRVSQRGQEFQLRQSQPERQSFSGRDAPPVRSRRQPRQEAGSQSPQSEEFRQEHAAAPVETGAPSQPYDFRQNDAPIHSDTHTTPIGDVVAHKPSLLDQVHEERSRAAPGEIPRGKQRDTAYQRHFQDDEAHPAAETPTRGSNSPNKPLDAPRPDTTPIPDSLPHRADTPETPRPRQAPHPDAPTRHTHGHVPEAGRSRLQFGEESRSSERAFASRQRDTRYTRKFAADTAKPDNPPDAARPDTAPVPDSPAHRAEMPEALRLRHPMGEVLRPDAPARHADGHVSEDSRSRLQFGEENHLPEHASASRQHGTRYARKFAADAAKPDNPPDAPNAAKSDSADPPPEAAPQNPAIPKLQFSADELPPEPPGKKLTHARRKAERLGGKLEKARDKLPARRRPAVKTTADPDTGKVKRRLYFEKEAKTCRQHLKGPLPLRPVKAAANTAVRYGHRKLYQVEEENVAVKAVHRTELAAEGLARSAYRFHKTRPYRRVAKLQHKSTKANVKLAYRQALRDNPQLKKNLLARMWQKQKIKRQYAKAAREAKQAGKTAKQAVSAAGRIAQAAAGFLRRHPVLSAAVALLLLLVFFLMTMLSSCGGMAGGGFSAILMSSYTAGDSDINDAALAYTRWETELLAQVNSAEEDYPAYDEYRYSVDEIGHDPFELMAYLTAKYRDFTFAQVEADLREIFAEQYTLTFTEEVETRYDDPDDSDDDGDLEPYDYYILHITLTSRSFTGIIASRLDSHQQEHYDLLMDSGGNRQHTFSPFAFDWLPYVSCYYGYRVHPITGAEDYHKAVDIAVAAGTDILATHDGTVTTAAWHDSYGNYIALDNGEGLVTKYAHCSQLLVSAGQEVKQGDIIARVGSTGDSTGPHLHFEVILNGEYLNPLFFSEGAAGE